ncbi:transmembrane protein 208 [Coccinella septempunctata]|uniref:transmembrane protein 208 n=1 Tax=Coccinella septempunctata TaxID=41139 RepID=UPI001D060E52|nr:transmembrane protein 208 [Coccinella septempunctata]
MNPPKKGKQGTRGAKQIVDENIETLKFYRNCALGTTVFAFIIMQFLYSSFSVLFILSCIVQFGAYKFMVYMSKATYSESGQLLDSGVDLNMTGGIAEHVKDVILLTSICQVTSLISYYFWLMWLSGPARAFYLLWKNVLGPYFFQSPPAQPEMDEKKQKKLERKMKRMQR